MIPKKSTKVKKSGRSKLIDRLDAVFSRFIRTRDCGSGYGRCISCNKPISFYTSDCGHYINRKHMSLRYDEHNCNAQCRSCNRFDEGNLQGYRRGLIDKIGEQATDMLEIKKHNDCKLSEFELQVLLKHYKSKLKSIENEL